MKSRTTLLTLFIAFLVASCTLSSKDTCTIEGKLNGLQYDGQWMYLVPLYRPDSIGVDSVKIKDAKFEFKTQKHLMSILRMGYRFRAEVQDLLVITEPGHIQVTMAPLSSGGGTPQNDSLQVWKQATEFHNLNYRLLLSQGKKEQADSLHTEYVKTTQKMAQNLKEGILYNFLSSLYPQN